MRLYKEAYVRFVYSYKLHPLSMLKSKYFDHYFQFKLRFYSQG